MLTNCVWVALGGGLGAVGRYLLSLVPVGTVFPVMTLLINLLGAVAIGGIAEAAGRLALPAGSVLFLKTGLCGGFTTFSTFSLETVGLLEGGRAVQAGWYMAASVGLCLAGVLLGRALVRAVAP